VIGHCFCGKVGQCFLHGRVEVQLAALHQLHDGRGGHRLGDRTQQVDSAPFGGRRVLQVGDAVTVGPEPALAISHCQRQSGNVLLRHSGRGGRFDLRQLLGRQRGRIRTLASRKTSRNNGQR